jgi:hypothetical protein
MRVRGELDWGKSQALYRAAPYSVINNPNTRLYEVIKPWKATHDPHTNPNLVVAELAREIAKYPPAARPLSLEQVRRVNLDLRTLEPSNFDQIETTLYPTAHSCDRCGLIVAEDPGSGVEANVRAVEALARRLPRDRRCTCGGKFRQWNLLTIHECGDTIHLPTYFAVRCKVHGFQAIHFLRHGSERSSDWEFACRLPGCNHRAAYNVLRWYHKGCRLEPLISAAPLKPTEKRRRMEFTTSPVQKATNFLPRVLRILNSDIGDSAPPPGTRGAEAVALGALRAERHFSNYAPHGGLRSWVDHYSSAQIASPAIVRKLQELAAKVDDPELKRQMLEISAAPSSAEDPTGSPEFGSLVTDPDYVAEAAAVAVFKDEHRSRDLAEIADDPTLSAEGRGIIVRAQDQASRMKIVDIRHVEDIALTSCLVGYTRGDYDPSRVALNLYLQHDPRRGISYRIYTNTTRTEGIFLQLDPTRSLEWLNARFPGSALPPARSFTPDLFALQRKFVASSIRMFGQGDDPWTAAHYSLLHTISHLLVASVAEFAGLEQEGLAEVVYPYQNGLLIYVNQSTDFSLEGLALAFEHHILEVLEGMVDSADFCPYNPECQARRSACHGCIHLAEISCENFNRLLGRKEASAAESGGFWA